MSATATLTHGGRSVEIRRPKAKPAKNLKAEEAKPGAEAPACVAADHLRATERSERCRPTGTHCAYLNSGKRSTDPEGVHCLEPQSQVTGTRRSCDHT